MDMICNIFMLNYSGRMSFLMNGKYVNNYIYWKCNGVLEKVKS